MNTQDKNRHMLVTLLLCAGLMVGFAYAFVPLYNHIFGAEALSLPVSQAVSARAASSRIVNVDFDSNVDPHLPWSFGPDVRDVNVRLGQVETVTFHARNNGKKTLVGTATFNVLPDKASPYVAEIQNFSMKKEVLKPGQSVELPVKFSVNPAIAENDQTNDVQNITLSYTFFLAKDQSEATAPPAKPATSTKSS